jgi:hypothetical protein
MQLATFIIDEKGGLTFLVNDAAAGFVTEDAVVRRASHVEPDALAFRILFHMLRFVFGDKGRMSELTRHWPCLWRVNTKPVGGPVLSSRWYDRQAAIDAEIVFLNRWFVGGDLD